MTTKKKLSAIIACYNDVEAIPLMHKRLTRVFTSLGVRYEIIFVNDGSLDTSEATLRTLATVDPHVVAINHSRNFGSQMAFTSGMDMATGDAVVFLDGDLQDPPEIIPQLYATWRSGYDVVYGIRENRDAPLYLTIASKWFYRLMRRLSYVNIPLDAGDFSLIDRQVANILKQFPERQRFLRGLRAFVGFKQTGVPYLRPKRRFGTSTNTMLTNIGWAAKGIINFSFVPLRLLTIGSIFLFILSFIAIAIQPSVMLVVVLFVAALQLLGLSILGQYISNIFEEVKQRPKYIVKSVFRKKASI